jgi:hypothetical protein
MNRFILSLIALAGLFVAGLRRQFATANAEGTTGTHEKAIGRYTDAALTTRHLLVKKGSDGDHIALAGAADLAIGTVADEAAAAEARVHVNLLGKGPTKKMVASAVIAAHVRVFQAAGGKVQTLPGAAGTYKCIGTSVSAAAADNDVIEVNDHAPFDVIVT